jgi:hydroxymethylpyrimidine pyrophosphatase-like HAD family hydrolase
MNLHDGQLLHSSGHATSDISCITEHLRQHRADFMVHHPVPDNHRFIYCGNPATNDDFNSRIQLYNSFAREYGRSAPFPATAAQIIAILSDNTEHFGLIKSGLKKYQVTRTTSPLDHRSIWMEILPRDTHKGSAAAWLCNHLGIDRAESVGIGNDYNDLDLLVFTGHSYLLSNAPAELHDRYHLGLANDENGFSKAITNATGEL